jgi:hypothetical protein
MNDLMADFLRRRNSYMPNPATQRQALFDNAPVGSVGMPGGLLTGEEKKPEGVGLGGLLGAGAMLPGPAGDVLGPLADAYMYATDPSSRKPSNYALSLAGLLPGMVSATVFHGSPHKFDAFDLSKIGTGEGAQAYGHGVYLADAPKVAKGYQEALAHKAPTIQEEAAKLADYTTQIKGRDTWVFSDGSAIAAKSDGSGYSALESVDNLRKKAPSDSLAYEVASRMDFKPQAPSNFYTADLPDEAIAKMLDWDSGGKQIYEDAVKKYGSKKAASEALLKQGIPGIRYLDGGSRGAGQGTSNYVVFDDKLPKILKRE